MSKKRTMQIDVIEEVKGKNRDSAGVLNTTNTFIEKD